MEKLETTLEEASIKEKKEEVEPVKNVGYSGLELIDERVHYSGTSIKYWM